MKSAALISLLLLSVIAATLLHSYKISHEDHEIDQLGRGLSGIEKFLGANSSVYYRQINGKDEIHTWVRYLITPRVCSFSLNPSDTILTIHNIHDNDSITHSIIDNRKILWQNKDNNYHYLLTSKK